MNLDTFLTNIARKTNTSVILATLQGAKETLWQDAPLPPTGDSTVASLSPALSFLLAYWRVSPQSVEILSCLPESVTDCNPVDGTEAAKRAERDDAGLGIEEEEDNGRRKKRRKIIMSPATEKMIGVFSLARSMLKVARQHWQRADRAAARAAGSDGSSTQHDDNVDQDDDVDIPFVPLGWDEEAVLREGALSLARALTRTEADRLLRCVDITQSLGSAHALLNVWETAISVDKTGGVARDMYNNLDWTNANLARWARHRGMENPTTRKPDLRVRVARIIFTCLRHMDRRAQGLAPLTNRVLQALFVDMRKDHSGYLRLIAHRLRILFMRDAATHAGRHALVNFLIQPAVGYGLAASITHPEPESAEIIVSILRDFLPYISSGDSGTVVVRRLVSRTNFRLLPADGPVRSFFLKMLTVSPSTAVAFWRSMDADLNPRPTEGWARSAAMLVESVEATQGQAASALAEDATRAPTDRISVDWAVPPIITHSLAIRSVQHAEATFRGTMLRVVAMCWRRVTMLATAQPSLDLSEARARLPTFEELSVVAVKEVPGASATHATVILDALVAASLADKEKAGVTQFSLLQLLTAVPTTEIALEPLVRALVESCTTPFLLRSTPLAELGDLFRCLLSHGLLDTLRRLLSHLHVSRATGVDEYRELECIVALARKEPERVCEVLGDFCVNRMARWSTGIVELLGGLDDDLVATVHRRLGRMSGLLADDQAAANDRARRLVVAGGKASEPETLALARFRESLRLDEATVTAVPFLVDGRAAIARFGDVLDEDTLADLVRSALWSDAAAVIDDTALVRTLVRRSAVSALLAVLAAVEGTLVVPWRHELLPILPALASAGDEDAFSRVLAVCGLPDEEGTDDGEGEAASKVDGEAAIDALFADAPGADDARVDWTGSFFRSLQGDAVARAAVRYGAGLVWHPDFPAAYVFTALGEQFGNEAIADAILRHMKVRDGMAGPLAGAFPLMFEALVGHKHKRGRLIAVCLVVLSDELAQAMRGAAVELVESDLRISSLKADVLSSVVARALRLEAYDLAAAIIGCVETGVIVLDDDAPILDEVWKVDPTVLLQRLRAKHWESAEADVSSAYSLARAEFARSTESEEEAGAVLDGGLSFLLLTVAHRAPTRFFDAYPLQQLMLAYTGGADLASTRLLELIQLAETTIGVSIAHHSYAFGPRHDRETLALFDFGRMRRTVQYVVSAGYAYNVRHVYDVYFVLPLLSHWLAEFGARMDVRQVMTSGALSLAIAATSSGDRDLRHLAYIVLAQVRALMPHTSSYLKEIQMLIDRLAGSTVEQASPQVPVRAAAFACLVDVLLDPSDKLYQPASLWLSHRDAVLQGVPLGSQDFFGTDDGRHFLLNACILGCRRRADVRLIQRRHMVEVSLRLLWSREAKYGDAKRAGLFLERVAAADTGKEASSIVPGVVALLPETEKLAVALADKVPPAARAMLLVAADHAKRAESVVPLVRALAAASARGEAVDAPAVLRLAAVCTDYEESTVASFLDLFRRHRCASLDYLRRAYAVVQKPSLRAAMRAAADTVRTEQE